MKVGHASQAVRRSGLGIRGRLILWSSALILPVLLAMGCACWLVWQTESKIQSLMAGEATQSEQAAKIASHTLQCRRYEKDVLLNLGEREARESYEQKWADSFAELEIALVEQIQNAETPGDASRLRAWYADAQSYRTHFLEVLEQIRSKEIRDPVAANSALALHKKEIRRLIERSSEALEGTHQALAKARIALLADLRVGGVTLATLGILVIFSGIFVSILTGSAFARRVLALDDETRRLARGDPGVRVEVLGNDELTELGKRFNEMAEGIEQRQSELVHALRDARAGTRAKSEFLATMSHELRTPMNGVLGMNEILLDTELTDQQRDCAETIAASGRGLLEIIDQVLDLSRIEAGALPLENIAFDLHSLLAEALTPMLPLAAQKEIAFRWELSKEVPQRILGDPTRIRQVLTNLVGNAVKFTETGEVMVRLGIVGEGTASRLSFSVKDTGIGFDPEQLERVLEPFTQADGSTTREFGGSGLGLAISMRLLELMQGDLRVESEPGRGSLFSFEVPFQVADADLEPIDSPPDLDPSEDADLWEDCCVLVAEDNAVNAKLVTLMLKKLGCRVELVTTGHAAVEQTLKGDHNLILMDCQMPEMDGYEATASIRAREAKDGGHLPIVALTANAMAGDRERCLEAGMDDYLSKPLSLKRLRQTLMRWVGV